MPRPVYLFIILILLTGLIYQYTTSSDYRSLNITNSPSPTQDQDSPTPTPTIKQDTRLTPKPAPTYYSGVDLWEQVQKYRREHGLPEFRQDNVLCTIASIRVNQMLELGKLDNHEGFSPLVEKMRNSGQLTHHNIAENILSGYLTPQEAVAGWDSSLGHRSLMLDGSFVYGCTAANYGFAVLIAAY